MANSKTVKVYCKDENVSIRIVSDSTKANIIIKSDGTILDTKRKFTEKNIVFDGSIDLVISNILIEIGIPVHLSSHHYAKEAIKMILNRPDIIHSVTKTLYPEITKMFNTAHSTVERTIRQAIEIAWIEGNNDFQDELFKYPNEHIRTGPSNSKFLFCIAEYVKISRKDIN